jgi:WhiB family transcriptional regulator, redox-sensing transcriptional regulator
MMFAVRPTSETRGVTPLDDLVLAAERPWADSSSDLWDLLSVIEPPSWMRDAACKEHPELNWFPEAENVIDARRAKSVCRRCLVRTECLAYAMSLGGLCRGIWGATSERERNRLRRG